MPRGSSTRISHWSTRRAHKFPTEIWKKACNLGFIGIHFPEKYGGQEYGILENALVVEEFCRQDSGLGIALTLSDFASEIILRCGTDEQKEKYLLPLTRGEALSSGGFTEPDHGSDITLMNTTAVRSGGRLCGERGQDLHHQRHHQQLRPGPLPDRRERAARVTAASPSSSWRGGRRGSRARMSGRRWASR